MDQRLYRAGQFARKAAVSIRTLRYYDQEGLLAPSQVSAAGYRHYTDADLEALQQILFFRELGFSLEEIKAIIHRPDFDRKQALATHKKLLLEKQMRLQQLIESVDQTIDRNRPMWSSSCFMSVLSSVS